MSSTKKTTNRVASNSGLKFFIPVLLILGLLTIFGIFSFLPGSQAVFNTTYGKRSSTAVGSVNGTWVLSEMFREAGYEVTTATALSPRVKQADVIVWAPDSYVGPSAEIREYFEAWLTEIDGRTLIYIGRDYDATIEYWEQVQSQVSTKDKIEYLRKKAEAQIRLDEARNYMPIAADYDWFTINRDQPKFQATALSGAWADGIDLNKAEIISHATFNFPQGDPQAVRNDWIEEFTLVEKLLSTKDTTLVARLEDDSWNSKIIVISNGSFLLNLPLVNAEHRKLAGKLIEECDSFGTVCFVESGESIRIIESDDAANANSGWEWLTVWPLNFAGFHFALLLIVLCFALFPYFGKPRRLPEEVISDFDKHIDSLGSLLEQTQDYDYAQLRVKQYQQIAKSETVYRRSRPKG